MFGGTNVDKRFDDIWSFDLVKLTWTEIKVEGIIPETRNGHSFCAFNNNLLLFGGIHDITHERNDLFIFKPSNNTWVVVDHDSSHVSDEDLVLNSKLHLGVDKKRENNNNQSNHHHHNNNNLNSSHRHLKTSPNKNIVIENSAFMKKSSVGSTYSPYIATQP